MDETTGKISYKWTKDLVYKITITFNNGDSDYIEYSPHGWTQIEVISRIIDWHKVYPNHIAYYQNQKDITYENKNLLPAIHLHRFTGHHASIILLDVMPSID